MQVLVYAVVAGLVVKLLVAAAAMHDNIPGLQKLHTMLASRTGRFLRAMYFLQLPNPSLNPNPIEIIDTPTLLVLPAKHINLLL